MAYLQYIEVEGFVGLEVHCPIVLFHSLQCEVAGEVLDCIILIVLVCEEHAVDEKQVCWVCWHEEVLLP